MKYEISLKQQNKSFVTWSWASVNCAIFLELLWKKKNWNFESVTPCAVGDRRWRLDDDWKLKSENWTADDANLNGHTIAVCTTVELPWLQNEIDELARKKNPHDLPVKKVDVLLMSINQKKNKSL